MSEQPDRLTLAIEAVIGFAWRWFWRIVFWGGVAFVLIFGIFWISAEAEKDRLGWFMILVGGLLGGILHATYETAKRLDVLIQQNNQMLKRSQPAPDYDWDD